MDRFEDCFSTVPDPRAVNAVHELTEILFISLAAMVCGATSCTDIADFGRAKQDLLHQVLRLPHGVPSHDTFSRVFRMLDPQAFEAAFRKFMAAFGKASSIKGVVAIDGKAVRGAYERGRKTTPLHLVNVWACEARMAMAQCTAPGRNEVAGMLQVLELVSLDGCIVTADALHCRRDVAGAILAKGADYVLALKDNQPRLLADVEALFASSLKRDCHRTAESGAHGRREHRKISVIDATGLAKTHNFPALAAVARLTTERLCGQRRETSVRTFVLSRNYEAKHLLDIIRQHWAIENSLHWVLDVVFKEDAARNRKDHGPHNLSIIRKLALNLISAHPEKASIRRKIKKAGWDNNFLLSIIAHMR